MNCEQCGVVLTVENQANGDEYAVFCKKCWDDSPLWEPVCEVCGEKMIQNAKNLFKIFCPISDKHPVIELVVV